MIFLSGLNLLTPEPGLVVWTVAVFLVVLAVLWLFAWKPIISQLDKRNHKVETDLNESRDLRERAEKLLEEMEARMAQTHQEASALVNDARIRAEKIKADMMKEASEEARKIKDNAQKEIENAKLKAIESIEGHVVDLTTDVLSRLFQGHFNEKDHRDIIQKEIQNIKH